MMRWLFLRRVIPVLIASTSSILVQASDPRHLEELDPLAKQEAAMQAFIAYSQSHEALLKSKKALAREKSDEVKRKAQAEIGKFISATDYTSTRANYNNGFATLTDVAESYSNYIELIQKNVKDPLTLAQEEVQVQEERVTKASKRLEALLELKNELSPY